MLDRSRNRQEKKKETYNFPVPTPKKTQVHVQKKNIVHGQKKKRVQFQKKKPTEHYYDRLKDDCPPGKDGDECRREKRKAAAGACLNCCGTTTGLLALLMAIAGIISLVLLLTYMYPAIDRLDAKDMLLMGVDDLHNERLNGLEAKDMLLMNNITDLSNLIEMLDGVLGGNVTEKLTDLMMTVMDLVAKDDILMEKDMILMVNITSLDARVTQNEEDIVDLQLATDVLLINITGLASRITANEEDIVELQAKDMVLMNNITILWGLIDEIGGLVGDNVTMKLTDLMMSIMNLEANAITSIVDGSGITVTPGPAPNQVTVSVYSEDLVTVLSTEPTFGPTLSPAICDDDGCNVVKSVTLNDAGTVYPAAVGGGLVILGGGGILTSVGPTSNTMNIDPDPATLIPTLAASPTFAPTIITSLDAAPTLGPTLGDNICSDDSCDVVKNITLDTGSITPAAGGAVVIIGGSGINTVASPSPDTMNINIVSDELVTVLSGEPTFAPTLAPGICAVCSSIKNITIDSGGPVGPDSGGNIEISGGTGLISTSTGPNNLQIDVDYPTLVTSLEAEPTLVPTLAPGICASDACANLTGGGGGITSIIIDDPPIIQPPFPSAAFRSTPLIISPTGVPGERKIESTHHLRLFYGDNTPIFPDNQRGAFYFNPDVGVSMRPVGGNNTNFLEITAQHVDGMGTTVTYTPASLPYQGSDVRIDLDLQAGPGLDIVLPPTDGPVQINLAQATGTAVCHWCSMYHDDASFDYQFIIPTTLRWYIIADRFVSLQFDLGDSLGMATHVSRTFTPSVEASTAIPVIRGYPFNLCAGVGTFAKYGGQQTLISTCAGFGGGACTCINPPMIGDVCVPPTTIPVPSSNAVFGKGTAWSYYMDVPLTYRDPSQALNFGGIINDGTTFMTLEKNTLLSVDIDQGVTITSKQFWYIT